MADPSLFSIFSKLAPSTRADTLSAVEAPDLPGIWVARDNDGNPLLLVEAESRVPNLPSLVLRHFAFQPWRTCVIDDGASPPRHLGASFLKCNASEPELRDYFFRASAAVLIDLPRQPSANDVAKCIDHLASLFRRLSLGPSQSLQGLWAELFILARSDDISQAVAAWQPVRRSLIDFVSGTQGLEVKSTSDSSRRHRFKLSQLQPHQGHTLYVASLHVQQSAHGTSLLDLWNRVEERLRLFPLARARIAGVIGNAAGEDWRYAESFRGDEVVADRSLALFEASAIPRVGETAPPSVTDIEFSVDLSNARESSLHEILMHGQLFRWLFLRS